MRERSILCLFCTGLMVVLIAVCSGCYRPGGPVPEDAKAPSPQAWTRGQVDRAVSVREIKIHSPAPRTNGEPPAVCDDIRFMRFKLKDTAEDPAGADAILVLSPGFLCGNNIFDYMGRQLVYMAKVQRGADIEVWAAERRSNTLEDLKGANRAERIRSTKAAIDYYYRGAELGGSRFAGYVTGRDAPYLSEFGLELYMKDLYTIITTMVPDPVVRREKVFVGGHSLGGPLTAYFAGWDFDGYPATTDDAGYMNCAGYVALDSVISVERGVSTGITETLGGDAVRAGEDDRSYYSQMVDGLRSGNVPRILPLSPITPEAMLLLELLGMEAKWAPDAESDLLDRIPYSDSVKLLLGVLHSRDLGNFLFNVPGMKDFRYTNEAQLGVVLDDNFMPVTIIQASCGFLGGGAVVRKDFPLPGWLAMNPLVQQLIGGMLSVTPLFIANDAGPSYLKLGRGPLYTWTNFDEVGDAADPEHRDLNGVLLYTAKSNEVTDILDLAFCLYRGPSNLAEWYFTSRLTLDLLFATEPWGPEFGLNCVHAERVNDNPKIEFLAEQGPSRSMFGYEPPGGIVRVIGYNHIDVLTAAANRPSHRENEIFLPVIDFMLENAGGS